MDHNWITSLVLRKKGLYYVKGKKQTQTSNKSCSTQDLFSTWCTESAYISAFLKHTDHTNLWRQHLSLKQNIFNELSSCENTIYEITLIISNSVQIAVSTNPIWTRNATSTLKMFTHCNPFWTKQKQLDVEEFKQL